MGIGKSTTLQAFTEVVGVVFPDVVGIYTSCLKLDGEHPLAKYALNLAVHKNLIERGYLAEDTLNYIPKGSLRKTPDPSIALDHAIQVANLRLFVVIDEMDLLFKVKYNEFNFKPLYTIRQLGGLADQEGGRWAVITCGSSSRLGGLIVADKTMKEEYPMLEATPNLNGIFLLFHS